MAIQRDSTYPGRWDTADADYPGGIPKNRTTPTSADGSYLEARLWKDTFGFMDAAIAQGDITRSGSPETAAASDVLDGIKAVTAGQALTWSATRNYTHPVIVAGSDEELYVSKQNSGPDTTVQDPTTDVTDTYWELLADAIGGGGVEAWSSGADYTNPVQVYGSDNRLYISQADSGPSGVGAQDPTTDDGTYWRVADNSFAYEFLHVQDQKATNSDGGSSSNGANTRDLNTVLTNGISGSSLLSNQITLPAGDYFIIASAPCVGGSQNFLTLYNVTDTAYVDDVKGQNSFVPSGNLSVAFLSGRFSIAATKDFEIRHVIEVTRSTDGLGINMGTATGFGGLVPHETYTDVMIWKVK